MNYVTIGRFTIPADLLAAFAAIFIGALIYRLKEKKSIGDWYWNSFFIYIAISKLSYILFNFKLFLDTPLALLYFNGGTKGQILAFAGIAVYLYYLSWKKKDETDTREFLFVYFLFFMLYETFLFSFSEGFLPAVFQGVLLFGFLLFYFKKGRISGQYAVLFLMLEALFFSIFSNLVIPENMAILSLGVVLVLINRLDKEEIQN